MNITCLFRTWPYSCIWLRNNTCPLSSSSSCADSIDFSQFLSPYLPIIHCSRQTLQITSSVRIGLRWIHSCCSVNTSTYMCWGPLRNVTWVHPCFSSSMSCSSCLYGLWDGKQVAVLLLSREVLLPEFVLWWQEFLHIDAETDVYAIPVSWYFISCCLCSFMHMMCILCSAADEVTGLFKVLTLNVTMFFASKLFWFEQNK